MATVTVRGAQGLVDNYWTHFAILDTAQLQTATDALRAGAMQDFRKEQFSNWLSRYGLKGGRLLEAGCGRGEYLRIMESCGPLHSLFLKS